MHAFLSRGAVLLLAGSSFSEMKRSFVHSPRKVFFGSPKLVITNDPLLVSGSNITYVIICILYSIYYIHQSIPKHKVNTTAPGFQNSVLGLDRFTCHVPHPCYPPESQPLASTPIKEQVHNWFKDIDIIYYPNLSNIIIVSVQGYYNVKLYIYILVQNLNIMLCSTVIL